MAHELSIIGGKATMAFVGETPWHGLGQRLTESAPIEQWAIEAGMSWQAAAAPVHFTRADGSQGSYGDKRVIYRTDTGAPLSVMGDTYKIVQPVECLEFFRDLIKGHGFKLHTAGVLNGGRKLWALAKNGHGGEIVKGDSVKQFLMLSTSLDGTAPTTAAFTQIRIVCANTLRMAHGALGADAVRTRHRSEFDPVAVREQLGLADQSWQAFSDTAKTLADTPITLEQSREILRGIFGQPKVKTPADSAAAITSQLMARVGVAKMIDAKEQKSVARVLELFAGAGRGALHPGVAGTRWGLLNAVTEHIDHEQGRSDDTRLNSAWFGRGDGFKQEALRALVAA